MLKMYWLPTAYNAVWMNAYLSKQINRKLTKLISKCSDQYNFDQQTDEQWKCAFVYRPLYWSSVGQHGHDDAVKATRVFHCINRSEMIMRSRKINIFLSIPKATSDRFIPPCIALHAKSILLDFVTILKWHAGDSRFCGLFYFCLNLY